MAPLSDALVQLTVAADSSETQQWLRTIVGALATGAAAAGAAWVAVTLTHRRNLERDDSAVSRDVAAELIGESETLAEHARTAVTMSEAAHLDGAIQAWAAALNRRRAGLVDDELASRLYRLTEDMQQLGAQIVSAEMHMRPGTGGEVRAGAVDLVRWGDATRREVEQLTGWIQASLFAHRARMPLPPRRPPTRWPAPGEFVLDI